MSSHRPIQEWPLESTPKRLEPAFLWEQPFDSIASLCNNGVYQMAHGGAIFSVADQACEAAGNSYGEPAVALQQNIHFLAAGKSGDFLEATARVTHRSNRIGLIKFEVKNREGLLMAIGQQVIYFRKGENDEGSMKVSRSKLLG